MIEPLKCVSVHKVPHLCDKCDRDVNQWEIKKGKDYVSYRPKEVKNFKAGHALKCEGFIPIEKCTSGKLYGASITYTSGKLREKTIYLYGDDDVEPIANDVIMRRVEKLKDHLDILLQVNHMKRDGSRCNAVISAISFWQNINEN